MPSGGAVLRDSYPDLYDLRIAAENYLVDAYEQYPPVFPLYCEIDDSTFKQEIVSQLGGIPALESVGENADFPLVSPVEGYDVTFTHATYKAKIQVSIESFQDDPKGVYTNLQNQINMAMKAALTRCERLAADMLIDGWSASLTSPDGQYLFDSDHPQSPTVTTQYQNYITTKLDAAGAAMQDMQTQVATFKDMAGNAITWPGAVCVVPSALKNNALKSLTAIYGTPYSISQQGVFSAAVGGSTAPTPAQTGALFAANGRTFRVDVVENPYIGSGNTSAKGNSGSNVKWYYIANPANTAPRTHSLRFYWRVRPQLFLTQINQNNGAFESLFLMRASCAPIDWRYAAGSDGTV